MYALFHTCIACQSLAPNTLSWVIHMQALKSLEVLDLHNNLMETLTGLTALTNLRRLNLAGNRISSICSLSMLTSLEDLDLNRNFLVSLAVSKPVSGDVDADAERTGGVEETYWPASLRKLTLAANRYSLPRAMATLNLVCICHQICMHEGKQMQVAPNIANYIVCVFDSIQPDKLTEGHRQT